jgi:hypothetical protein
VAGSPLKGSTAFAQYLDDRQIALLASEPKRMPFVGVGISSSDVKTLYG